MNRYGLWAIVSLLFVNGTPAIQKNFVPAPGIAVVELFTSEGCSSCPPADDALAAVANAYTNHVYVMGYHVDYWDRLGWKDNFSDAAWTSRQRRYAEQFNLTSIYTPQAIVNGQTGFTGSDRNRLFGTIESELKKPAGPAPVLDARIGEDKNTITVSCQTGAQPGKLLNIALVQRSAGTQVKRGENEGKRLHHINIVRALKTLPAGPASVSFRLPAGLPAADCLLIAFIQDKQSLTISAASEAAIH